MRNNTLVHSPIYFISTLFYLLFGNYAGYIMQDGFNWGTAIVLFIVFFIVSIFLDRMIEDKARQVYMRKKA